MINLQMLFINFDENDIDADRAVRRTSVVYLVFDRYET